jgi:multidrug efflux system membrane fusion protein
MKSWLRWLIVALILAAVAGAVLRAVKARKTQQEAVAAAAASRAPLAVELATTERITVAERELSQGIAISGTVRAVRSAVVKARVAGELQGLVVREGDTVRAGQELARIDPAEARSRVQQAQQQAEAARAQIEIAQRQFDNNRALVDQGFISRTALDLSQSSLAAARATHQAAQAAVELAGKSLADTVLVAPIAGQVSQRLAQPGERVGVDARIVEIVDLTQMELEVTVPAEEAAAVRVGQTATVAVEGAPAPQTARVARINPSVQAGSRQVLVYLALAPSPTLRQGLFARGTLATGTVRALAVPVTALRTDKPAPYVQVVENGQVTHRTVATGARGDAEGQAFVAIDGLTAGATVIAGTAGVLRPGTPVKPLAAPATAASAAPAAAAAGER